MFPVCEEVMHLERECDEEKHPSERCEDGDIPVLLFLDAHFGGLILFGFQERSIERAQVASDFLDDGFELPLIAHFGFAVEISQEFAFIHGC